MIERMTGIELLQKNLNKVEEKFITFFQHHEPRWPSETCDYLRNHHQSLSRFTASNITLEKLQFTDLPEEILEQVRLAFEAFKRSEDFA